MKILFVCTGNTCRSPMAAALALERARHSGSPHGFASAGIAAAVGAPASPLAQELLAERNLDLRDHRAQQITPELIEASDRIYTMTRSHADILRRAFPEAQDKISTLLGNADIPDPFGGDRSHYKASCQAIQQGLDRIFDHEEEET